MRRAAASGWYRVGPLYILSGLFGVAVSTVLLPSVVSVGASGSIFGLLGALWGELAINYASSPQCSLCAGWVAQLLCTSALSLATGFTPWVDSNHGCGSNSGRAGHD